MPFDGITPGSDGPAMTRPLADLDRVSLKSPLIIKDRVLASGMIGTVVYCHGAQAFEVEFPEIYDIFQIAADDLDKI